MVNSKIVMANLLAIGGVFATPVSTDETSHLAKRAEGIHLFNCQHRSTTGGIMGYQSIVVYCANDNDCNDYVYNPPKNNMCIMSNGNLHTWEGGAQSCTFPTGVTFSWNIPSNAQSFALGASVGTGWNGRSWQGHKDNNHDALFIDLDRICKSIYYYL